MLIHFPVESTHLDLISAADIPTEDFMDKSFSR